MVGTSASDRSLGGSLRRQVRIGQKADRRRHRRQETVEAESTADRGAWRRRRPYGGRLDLDGARKSATAAARRGKAAPGRRCQKRNDIGENAARECPRSLQ